MTAYAFLILSLILQGLAAVLALHVIPVSGRRFPWIVISMALMVRFCREGITLWLHLVQGFALNQIEEGIALTVSALFLVGVTAIRPIFLQLQSALSERESLLEKARQARRRADDDRLRLRTVIEHLPVGLAIVETDGRLAEVNEAGRRIWGGTVPLVGSIGEYAVFKGWWVRSGEPIAPEEWGAARAIRFGETSIEEMIEIERFDGLHATMLQSAVPIRSHDEKIVGAVMVLQDITDRKRLQDEREELLRQASRQAAEREAIIHALPAGVILYAPDGAISHMNPAGERISAFFPSGMAAGPSAGRSIRVHRRGGEPLDMKDFPARAALQGEEIDGDILVLENPPEEATYLLLHAAPIRAEGEIVGAVATFTDITRLQELQEQNQTFVQMISHDLRTPLTAIQGHAELLLASLAGNPLEVHLQAILAGTQMMGRMMEDLSDLSRLEHKQFSIDKQPLDLAGFFPSLLARLQHFIDIDRVRLVLPAGLPPVMADPMGLERIIVNLLTNALKYSPGSPVRISASRSPGTLQITVADRGPGIDAEDLPYIFERFYRGGSAGQSKGSGLGLYISRLLAEAHGGKLRAISRVGKGTAFILSLPGDPLFPS